MSAAPSPGPPGRTGFLRRVMVDTRPLAVRPYRRILIGQGTAFIGTMVTEVAVPVQIYAISHSSLYVGLTGLAGLVPIVIFGLYGGVLVGLPHGFAYAYGADALLFTAALYSALGLPAIPPAAGAAGRGVRAVLDGLRFISGNRILLMSFGVDIAAMVLAMPRALFPEAAATRFHGGVGLLYSSVAIGSVLAGLCSGWIGRVRRQGVALTVAVVGWGAAITVAGFAHALWLAVAFLALAGAADLISAVYRQTILQTYAPDEMRGRMQGVLTVVVAGGPRLGDLRAGAMAAATTLTIAWSGGAIACIVVVLLGAALVRPFWRYDAQATPPAGDQESPAVDQESDPVAGGRE